MVVREVVLGGKRYHKDTAANLFQIVSSNGGYVDRFSCDYSLRTGEGTLIIHILGISIMITLDFDCPVKLLHFASTMPIKENYDDVGFSKRLLQLMLKSLD